MRSGLDLETRKRLKELGFRCEESKDSLPNPDFEELINEVGKEANNQGLYLESIFRTPSHFFKYFFYVAIFEESKGPIPLKVIYKSDEIFSGEFFECLLAAVKAWIWLKERRENSER